MTQKSLKKNTVFSAVKTGASILFPLITFPYISRTLLTDNVGKINFGLSIVSYFSLIASLGISTYAIRECSSVKDDKEKLSDVASQIFSINIITTVIAYLALLVTILFWRKLDNYRVLIVIQSMSILATTLGADWLNQAMEDFKFITIRAITFQFLSLILMFVFVHRPEDYMIYAVICLISTAGASITNIWYRRRYCKVNFTLKIEWKRHMTPIIYLFVMVLAQTVFNSVDTTMLGTIHGDYEVGIYGTAHKILNIINQVIGSLIWVIMPRMSYYFAEKDYDSVNRLLRKVLGFNLMLGLPCVVGCCMLSEDIILVVAGKSYIEAAPVLQILMLGFAISLIGGNFLGNAILLPSKEERYYMIVCCIAAGVNILGNYLFIPTYGSIAAAGTTAVCSLTILIFLFFKVDKNIKLTKVRNIVLGPVVGCIAIAVICYLCKTIETLWCRVVLSLCGSAGVYFVSQIVAKNELIYDVLNGIKKKVGITSGEKI